MKLTEKIKIFFSFLWLYRIFSVRGAKLKPHEVKHIYDCKEGSHSLFVNGHHSITTSNVTSIIVELDFLMAVIFNMDAGDTAKRLIDNRLDEVVMLLGSDGGVAYFKYTFDIKDTN